MDISLALGGGGAKGNSHIGVIRRLANEGYRIRAIAGTSFGGLVAVLYAAGYSADEIEEIFSSVDQSRLYGREPQDGPALLGLAGVRKWLRDVVGDKTFEDLKIPCAVTAVDIHTSNEVILASGFLKDAILATIALPGIFPPHKINEWVLMDGGVLDPVPVSVARMLAPDLPVVAVVLTDSLQAPVRAYHLPMPSILPRSIMDRISRMNFAQAFDIFMRAVDLSGRSVAYYRLQVDTPEVIVRPEVQHLSLLDKVDVREVARLGEVAVEKVLPELERATSWVNRLGRKLVKVLR
jgi:NTE family protein